MMDRLLAHFEDATWLILGAPADVTSKFFVGVLGMTALLAYVSYRRHETGGTDFWRFFLPKRIYLHPSARVDYAIYAINVFLSPLVLVAAGLQALISIEIGNGLVGLNGGEPVFRGDWNAWTYAGFILGYTLIADFSVYVIHRWHHQSEILWPLHALHHSAEVLTPFTLFRKHPVWNLTSHTLAMTFTGVFQGVFLFFFYGGPAVELLFGLNTVYVFYNLLGANLRHSHVWLSWGKPLSYIFISPAMHQIHHDPARMRKNYGEIFAIWDGLFGTLYVPEERERFAIGLGDDNPHTTVAKAYYVPVVECAAEIWRALKSLGRRSSST